MRFFQFKFLGHVVNFCLITLSCIWSETYLLTNTLTCVFRIMLESSLSSIKTNIALCILYRAPRRPSEVIFCNTQHLESEIKLVLNTKRVFEETADIAGKWYWFAYLILKATTIPQRNKHNQYRPHKTHTGTIAEHVAYALHNNVGCGKDFSCV